MCSHSAKSRKYSSAVPCAKTGVRTLCRNGCHASVAKHISRRDSTSTMATTLHAHKLVHTGRRGSTRSCGCNSKHTLLSYTYLKSCLFFFSFVQKGKWANRSAFKILTETTSTSDWITAGSTKLGAAQSGIL